MFKNKKSLLSRLETKRVFLFQFHQKQTLNLYLIIYDPENFFFIVGKITPDILPTIKTLPANFNLMIIIMSGFMVLYSDVHILT